MPVTAADRETAAQVLHDLSRTMVNLRDGYREHDRRKLRDAIAAALAEQRERHVADLERIADALDSNGIRGSAVKFCRERIAGLKGEPVDQTPEKRA